MKKLQQILNQKLQHADFNDVAQIMGYHGDLSSAAKRIGVVLSDSELGLGSGIFDFKYNSVEFLVSLCQAVGIKEQEYLADIKEIQSYRDKKRSAYKSHVFVDTDFKRKGETIVSLAVLSHLRFIYLDMEVRLLPVHKQIERVKDIVHEHYKQNNGSITLWGEIKRYRFFYAKNKSLVFSVDGRILQEGNEFTPPRAGLFIGNRDITSVVKIVKNVSE